MVDALTIVTFALVVMAGIQAIALFLNFRATDKLSSNTAEVAKATLVLAEASESLEKTQIMPRLMYADSVFWEAKKQTSVRFANRGLGKAFEIRVLARVSQGREITGQEAQFELEYERQHKFLEAGAFMDLILGNLSPGYHRVELTMKCADLKGTEYTNVEQADVPTPTVTATPKT